MGINSQITGYEITRKLTDSSDFISIFTAPANTETYLDVSLRNGTSYDYRIFGINNFGPAIHSDTITQTTPK